MRVIGNVGMQEFQRDKAAQFGVFSFVYDTHAATTKLFDDVVVRDSLANHWAEMLGPVIRQVNEGEVT